MWVDEINESHPWLNLTIHVKSTNSLIFIFQTSIVGGAGIWSFES